MSILDNNIGTLYKRVDDVYSVRGFTFPGNAVHQVVNMLREKQYPVEGMPTKKELYRMVQDELTQFNFISFFEFEHVTGLRLRIRDKNDWKLGYISISER